jgi:predicted transcriptional regulator
MTETTTISVRISTSARNRLARLAKRTKRSQAFLAAEAIEDFLDLNEWQVAGIEEAIEQADRGELVPHEDVEAWVKSWGKKDELPRPKPK